MTVFSILSETTRPRRTLRKARWPSVSWLVSCCVSVIPFLSGHAAAAGLPRPGGPRLAGLRSFHVLGCLLVLGRPGARRGGRGVRHRLLGRLVLMALVVMSLGRLGQADGVHAGQVRRGHVQRPLEAADVHHRQDPRDVLAHLPDLPVVVQLPDGVLEAQLVELAPRALEAAAQLVGVQRPQVLGLHCSPPPACAACGSTTATKRVRTGSLAAARRMASLATSWLTPPISNRMRPGLMTATQPSGLPLPEPMRVSAGFLVTGLARKTRIQIWPPRRTCRVMARLAASICRFVIQQASVACSANWPNAMVLPRVAMPARRPLCCLRCLTRLGRSMAALPRARAAGALATATRALATAAGVL